MLAYFVHNEALDLLHGRSFDFQEALARLPSEQRSAIAELLALSDFKKLLAEADEALNKHATLQVLLRPLQRVRELVRLNPSMNDTFSATTLSLWRRDGIDHEVLGHVLHLFRWPQLHEAIRKEQAAAIDSNDWRAIPVLTRLIAAFEDDWTDRELLPELHLCHSGLSPQPGDSAKRELVGRPCTTAGKAPEAS